MPSESAAMSQASGPPSPGAQLRRAREARGETINEVAFALKLSPRQVEALEHDDFAALPGMALVRGFMRNYARYLGLDAAPLMDAVQRLAGQGAVDLSPIRNAEGDLPSGGGRRSSGAPAGMIVLVLVLLVAAGWYFDWFRTEPPANVETIEPPLAIEPVLPQAVPLVPPVPEPVAPSAPVEVLPPAATSSAADAAEGASGAPIASAPAATAEAPVASALAPAAPNSAPAADAPTPGGALVLRFAGESWVEIRDAGGSIVYSGINRAGSSRTVQGKPPFALVVGNAANVSVEFDGRPVDLVPHTKVSVARLTVK